MGTLTNMEAKAQIRKLEDSNIALEGQFRTANSQFKATCDAIKTALTANKEAMDLIPVFTSDDKAQIDVLVTEIDAEVKAIGE